jgi:ankyrin repeat protein
MTDDKPEYVQPAAGQNGMNRLHEVAYSGDIEAATEAIRRGIDVNSVDEMRWTPLHWVVDMGAVEGERAEIIEALIAAGADLNPQECGCTDPADRCVAGRERQPLARLRSPRRIP